MCVCVCVFQGPISIQQPLQHIRVGCVDQRSPTWCTSTTRSSQQWAASLCLGISYAAPQPKIYCTKGWLLNTWRLIYSKLPNRSPALGIILFGFGVMTMSDFIHCNSLQASFPRVTFMVCECLWMAWHWLRPILVRWKMKACATANQWTHAKT